MISPGDFLEAFKSSPLFWSQCTFFRYFFQKFVEVKKKVLDSQTSNKIFISFKNTILYEYYPFFC